MNRQSVSGTTVEDIHNSGGAGRKSDRFFPFVLFIVAAFIIAGGVAYYRNQAADKRDVARESLVTVADLQVKVIANWMRERLGDAEVVRASMVIRGVVANPGNAQALQAAAGPVRVFRNVYGYAAVVVTDAQGRLLMKDPPDISLPALAVAEQTQAALHSSRVATSNLTRPRPGEPVYFWVLCPIFAHGQPAAKPDGAVLLAVDPHDFLFPTIQTWPVPSRTAETMLVLPQGDRIVYVNQLRQNFNATTDFSLPVGGKLGIPASMAVRGFEGIVEGLDYRGVPVLAVTRKIPGTPWFLVAKMDVDEIDAPIRHEAWMATAITALLVTTVLLGIAFFWRRKRFEALREGALRFQTLIERAPVAIGLGRNGNILYVNRKYLDLYRYNSLAEIVGQRVVGQWAPESRGMIEELHRKRARGETTRQDLEGIGLRHDGTQFDLHATVDVIELPDGPAAVAFANDISERKRAEEALRLFRALVDRSNDAIEVIDPVTGQFLDVNEKASAVHGYTRDEYMGLTVDDIDPKLESRVEGGLVGHISALKQKGSMIFEAEHRRKDGSFFPVEINASYICLERDYILAVVRDISDRKQAEQQIRRLNRLYAVLSGINTLIVRERDPQTMLAAACNEAIETGGFRMAWIGMLDDAMQVLKPVASAGVVDGYMEVLDIDLKSATRSAGPTGRAVQTGEYQVCNDIATDPRLSPWRDVALQRGYRSAAAFPLSIAGRVAGAFILYSAETDFFNLEEIRLLDELAKDIGFALEVNEKEMERQRAETNLRSSEERFRLLIENASDMVTVMNGGGIIGYSSPSVTRQLGYQEEELLNRNCFEIVHPEDRMKATSAIEHTISDPAATNVVECRVQHRDGSWRILEIIGRSVPDMAADGFVVLNSRDVTESRSLEEQFRQSQKMEGIGQLAGGVAHDFNNLLSATMMLCELTQMMPDLPEQAQANLRDILSVTESAANLTRQLLLFSRRQVMQPRNLDINESVTGITKFLQRIIGEDINIQLNVHTAPLVTHADPGMLDQVLMNLSVNARDAMPEGGRLVIETSLKTVDESMAHRYPDATPGRYACLRVSDTGEGIPPEIMSRIFEPFFTTKEAGKGTGLGLATVFGIVKQHGGWLTVDTKVGEGTSFEAYFPLITASAESANGRAAKDEPSGGTETILLVEDDKMVMMMTRTILDHVGYRVLEAAHGVEALEVWDRESGKVDLLLTDLVMPEGISGRQLATILQKRKPELKVVLTSGYSADIAGTELMPQQGQIFVQKPCSGYQLLEAVRTCLDG
jgi:two-component system cell cycle sensor histidine kinase/response regulator CckA